MRHCLIAVCILIMSAPIATADDGPFVFEFEQLAPDVWAGVRPDGPRFPVMGNTVFVIGDTGVVVFDGGGMPAMADQIIDKIAAVTDKPVTHVVISHWHGDHSFGAFRFAEEFEGVQFIAHEFTRDMINSSRINYIDRERGYFETNRAEFEKIVATGVDSDGNEHSDISRANYKRTLDDFAIIETEFRRAKVTPPDVVITDTYSIDLGNRKAELAFLGHANTAGDIVMWLPEDRIVATGDVVVLPSPYAFNAPPRAWAETLRNVNELGYDTLVPGHGAVQRDTAYVDLLIEAADSIADQRDRLLAGGKSNDEAQAALDFSAFEERITKNDAYLQIFYEAWFEAPFRAAAMKVLGGQQMVVIPPPESVPFDDERWQIEAAEFEVGEHLGRRALKIKGGAALLPELDIRNGLVEFDIAITPERGFAGLVFRLQDEANYEHFYIRPHQSGNPDANQYQPVYNGAAAWQLYPSTAYGVPVDYRYDEWLPVKIIYAGSHAEIYIDSDEPVLVIKDLNREQHSGAIGVSAANFSPVHFANFRYTKLANAYAFPPNFAADQAPVGTIRSWQVSAAFDEASLEGISQLDKELQRDRQWTALAAEANGTTNLAKVQGIEDGRNTVFARHVVTAERAASTLLNFGYSDRARVYLNGTLIYTGNNGYLTRDYRYLGTIGLFDSVVLPLKKGENELWIAVSEDFGGWGVIAAIPAPGMELWRSSQIKR